MTVHPPSTEAAGLPASPQVTVIGPEAVPTRMIGAGRDPVRLGRSRHETSIRHNWVQAGVALPVDAVARRAA